MPEPSLPITCAIARPPSFALHLPISVGNFFNSAILDDAKPPRRSPAGGACRTFLVDAQKPATKRPSFHLPHVAWSDLDQLISYQLLTKSNLQDRNRRLSAKAIITRSEEFSRRNNCRTNQGHCRANAAIIQARAIDPEVFCTSLNGPIASGEKTADSRAAGCWSAQPSFLAQLASLV